jgi:hypothetical protein
VVACPTHTADGVAIHRRLAAVEAQPYRERGSPGERDAHC